MADTSHRPPGHLELTGEYLAAMEAISANLMDRLPDSEELWQILGQTETLLLQAQLVQTPIKDLFGKGGIAVFCQSIIDEQLHGKKETPPASVTVSRERKQRKTTNERIRKKKNLVTLIILVVWLLIIAILVSWYTGVIAYLLHPHEAYLSELYNFSSETTVLQNTEVHLTLSLSSEGVQRQELYRNGEDYVTLTYLGYDEDTLSAEKGGFRRYWIELSYPRHTSFSEVTYTSPSETGTSTVTLPSGELLTQSIHWKDDDCNDEGIASVKLYVLFLPKDTDPKNLAIDISLDPMVHVRWTRNTVGPRAQ